MLTEHKRIILFLGGCIPLRLTLVALAKYLPPKYLPMMGYLALLPAGGFTYLYLTDSRKTGFETFGAPIWWRPFRIVHALFYFLFAYLALQRQPQAYLALLIDVLLGLGLFLWQHFLHLRTF
jgi:hypothetical protein